MSKSEGNPKAEGRPIRGVPRVERGLSAPGEASPSELLRRVRRIELRATRLVEDWMAGAYRSRFRGVGLEFDEVREYQPGDDVRSIAWHATARSGGVQIKQHVEERQQTVWLVVDVSASGGFGSGPQSKRELQAELAAALALSAVWNNDRVGWVLFTDRIEAHRAPAGGRRQALAAVSALLQHRPSSRRTDLRRVLETLGQACRRRATLILLSDFLDGGFERALGVVSQRHEVVALRVSDPAETALPPVGWLVCEDLETGECVEVHTGSAVGRRAMAVERLRRLEVWRDGFRRAGVETLECETGRPYAAALRTFFEARARGG